MATDDGMDHGRPLAAVAENRYPARMPGRGVAERVRRADGVLLWRTIA